MWDCKKLSLRAAEALTVLLCPCGRTVSAGGGAGGRHARTRAHNAAFRSIAQLPWVLGAARWSLGGWGDVGGHCRARGALQGSRWRRAGGGGWSEADVAVAALWVRDGGAQVLEETGLSLAEEDLTPLAMWESNYPIHIDVRAPWLPCCSALVCMSACTCAQLSTVRK